MFPYPCLNLALSSFLIFASVTNMSSQFVALTLFDCLIFRALWHMLISLQVFYFVNCLFLFFAHLSTGNAVFVLLTFRSPAATAAAKSLQSCPILCDPIDGSPPGSPVPGIFQARTLEWVAISFSFSSGVLIYSKYQSLDSLKTL